MLSHALVAFIVVKNNVNSIKINTLGTSTGLFLARGLHGVNNITNFTKCHHPTYMNLLITIHCNVFHGNYENKPKHSADWSPCCAAH